MTQQITITSAVGLSYTSNSLAAPDGAYEVADNITISRDGIAQKRRGFELNIKDITDPKSMAEFKDFLYVAHNNKFAKVNIQAGLLTQLSGDLPAETLIPRYAIQGGALFITSDDGVKKVETTADSEMIRDVGVAPGLDLSAELQDEAEGAIEPNCQVAYRILFGRKDQNDNLLLGAPSELTVLTNFMIEATYSRASTVVTVTTPEPHGQTGDWFVKITTASDVGLEKTSTLATTVDATTFTYVTTADGDVTGDLSYGYWRNVDLDFTIPSSVDSSYFYEVYRSQPSISQDVPPEENLQLVEQKDVETTGSIQYEDKTQKELLGASLYTNPNQEGILQANTQPPKCEDIANFKNVLFYANTESKHNRRIKLIDTKPSTIAEGDELYVVNKDNGYVVTDVQWQFGTTVRLNVETSQQVGEYITISGCANSVNNGTFEITFVQSSYIQINNEDATSTAINETNIEANGSSTRVYKASATENFDTVYGGDYKLTPASSQSFVLPIDQTARSICKVINRDSKSKVLARYVSGIEDTPGDMLFSSKEFAKPFCLTASSGGNAFSPELNTDPTKVESSNEELANQMYFSKTNEPEAVPLTNYIAVGSKSEEILRIVALRDSLIVIKSDGVYALRGDDPTNFSVTLLDSTVLCKSGNSVATLSNQVYMVSNQGVVTISESGVAVISRSIETKFNAAFTNPKYSEVTSAVGYESERLYIVTTMSPFAKDEADVVYVYNFVTGSWTTWDATFKDALVYSVNDKLHVLDTADDLVIERKNFNKLDYADKDFPFKVDNVFSPTQITITHAADQDPVQGSVLVVGQTIVRIDQVEIISESISKLTLGTAISYRDGNNVVYDNQNYSQVGNLVTVTTDPDHLITIGDQVLMKITNATETSVNTDEVVATAISDNEFTFESTVSSNNNGTLSYGVIDSGSVYEGYNAQIATTPLTAGDTSRWKQFSEFQLHFRSRSASYVIVNFANDSVRTSQSKTWKAKYSAEGWGVSPWGQFDWGLDTGFDTPFDTLPAQPLRVYTPLDIQRGTYIKAIIENNIATESLDIQAMSFTIRAMGPKITR